jgi:hypothetical protein
VLELATGSCLCGAVRFDAELPSKWVAHCHCTLCRRAHGAAFVTWVGMDVTRVTLTDADGVLRFYESTPGADRGFCSRCGSMMFFRSTRWPGELHIARALFEADVDRAPQVHVFWDRHVDWVALDPDDGLPRKNAI